MWLYKPLHLIMVIANYHCLLVMVNTHSCYWQYSLPSSWHDNMVHYIVSYWYWEHPNSHKTNILFCSNIWLNWSTQNIWCPNTIWTKMRIIFSDFSTVSASMHLCPTSYFHQRMTSSPNKIVQHHSFNAPQLVPNNILVLPDD